MSCRSLFVTQSPCDTLRRIAPTMRVAAHFQPGGAAVLLIALVALTPTTQGQQATSPEQPHPRPFQVVAYVPEYRIGALDPAVGAMVSDLIFFSLEPRADGSLSTTHLDPSTLTKLHEIKKRRHTRLLVAFGGWNRSSGFPAVAGNAAARERFAANVARFCVDQQLDGADMDWEHPANAKENRDYAALLTELKRIFQPKGLIVTTALADWQDPGKAAYDAVDRIHVMAYDHSGPRHSTLEHAKADLDRFVARGVPKEKLLLGVPFYGRGMNNRQVEAVYADIVRKYRPARDSDEAGDIYFNGIDTIQKKTRYARDHGFGGVMIWELGQDSAGAATSLLRAIGDVVSKP